MPNSNTRGNIQAQDIIIALMSALATFDPGELSYLAMTSNVELSICDRLAWSIQSSATGIVVAREWFRHDLAIFEEDDLSAPVMVIQAKAMATSESMSEKTLEKFAGWFRSDIETASAAVMKAAKPGDGTGVFLLLTVTYIYRPIEPRLENIVKHQVGMNEWTIQGSRLEAQRLVAQRFADLGRMTRLSVDPSEAFSTTIGLDVFLFGPTTVSS